MFRVTIAVAALLVVGSVCPAQADNEYEGRRRATTLQDFRGTHELRTDPATVNNVGFAHPLQVLLTSGPDGDFLAIGTTNGLGSPSTDVWNCPNEYDAKWSIYTDGQVAGVMFCRLEAANVYTTGDVVPFRIFNARCNDFTTEVGWKMNMGGTNWDCYVRPQGLALESVAMLEATGFIFNDYNLDVKFRSLQAQAAGPPWVSWGPGTSIHTPGTGYAYSYFNSEGFDAYLPPMN